MPVGERTPEHAATSVEDPSIQRFTPDGATRPVLDGIDLTVRRGEWVLVMGPSGSGKTTLALTMNGCVPHLVTGKFEAPLYTSDAHDVSRDEEAGGVRLCSTPPRC